MAYEPINLFSEIEKNKGFSEEEICEAENRLGFRLPEELRLFYKSQGKNIALKSQTEIVKPQYLSLDKKGWLIFWAEDVGVCFWAINIKDFERKELPIYIRHDEYEFEKEANSLADFITIRAAGDCSHYIYPYVMHGNVITDNDDEEIKKILGDAKSDVNTTRHFHVKLFWETPNFVVKTVKYSNNRGYKIVVYSKFEKEILALTKKFSHLDWVIKSDKFLKVQEKIKFIESLKLKKENQYKDVIKIEDVKNDLPF